MKAARNGWKAATTTAALLVGPLVVFSMIATPTAEAAATQAASTDWAGSSFCSTGAPNPAPYTGNSYDGVAACGTAYGDGGNSNEQGPVSYDGVRFDSVGFQCVELVMRYMYYNFGVAPYSANGNTVVSNYSGSVFTKETNPAADGLPSVGDILSFAGTSSNPFGHTSIVIGVSSSSLTTLNENDTSNGLDTVPVSNGVVGGGVTGWLHNPGGGGGPPTNGQRFVESGQTQQYIDWYGASLPLSYGDAQAYNSEDNTQVITDTTNFAATNPASNFPSSSVVRIVGTPQQYFYINGTLEPIGDPATSACLLDVRQQASPAVVPTMWSDPIPIASPVSCNLPNGTIEVEGTGTAASQYFTWGSDVLPISYGDSEAYDAMGYPAGIVLPAGYAADHTTGMPTDTVVRAANSPSQYLYLNGQMYPVPNPAASACLTDNGAGGVAVVPPSWLDAQTVVSTNASCNLPNGTIEVEGTGTAASQYFTWGSDVLPISYGDSEAYDAMGYPAGIVLPAGYAADHTTGMPTDTVVRAANSPSQYLWTDGVLEPVADPSTSTCLLDNGASGVAVAPPSWVAAQSVASQGAKCPVPVISSISPTSGSTSGGTTVTIIGTGFGGATRVTFGTTSAASYTVVSSTKITAVSPAESASTKNIRVTTAGGTSAVVSGDKFTFKVPVPVISSISPTSGSTSGGTTVTIIGTGFGGATKVTFGTTSAAGYTVVSSTKITVVSPAESASTKNIRVTTAGGTSAVVSGDKFTFK